MWSIPKGMIFSPPFNKKENIMKFHLLLLFLVIASSLNAQVEIPEVPIYSYKQEIKQRDSGRNIQVITRKEIDQIPSNSVDDLIRQLPGVEVQSRGGFGVQGDRFLINQSASNSLVYAAASGGVAGLIALILFSIIGLYYAINCIFTINKKRFSWYQKASSIIILMILARSLLESSYAVFGIDSILFALCAITLGKKFDKISWLILLHALYVYF